MKRQGTIPRVEHVRPGMGHSNPVDVSDEMLDAGGGFATVDFDQRQSLRKSTKRGVNNNSKKLFLSRLSVSNKFVLNTHGTIENFVF